MFCWRGFNKISFSNCNKSQNMTFLMKLFPRISGPAHCHVCSKDLGRSGKETFHSVVSRVLCIKILSIPSRWSQSQKQNYPLAERSTHTFRKPTLVNLFLRSCKKMRETWEPRRNRDEAHNLSERCSSEASINLTKDELQQWKELIFQSKHFDLLPWVQKVTRPNQILKNNRGQSFYEIILNFSRCTATFPRPSPRAPQHCYLIMWYAKVAFSDTHADGDLWNCFDHRLAA